jgi:hypothetical protein
MHSGVMGTRKPDLRSGRHGGHGKNSRKPGMKGIGVTKKPNYNRTILSLIFNYNWLPHNTGEEVTGLSFETATKHRARGIELLHSLQIRHANNLYRNLQWAKKTLHATER